MKKKGQSIPVNKLPEEFEAGIAVGKSPRGSVFSLESAGTTHRHDYHIFLLVEAGSLEIELDFEIYSVRSSNLLYIHPNQVHRIVEGEAAVYFLGISTENIHAGYLSLLDEIAPAIPIDIDSSTLDTAIQLLNLCEKILEDKSNRFRLQMLQNCGNAFLGLSVSRYAEQKPMSDTLPRYEQLSKHFRLLLEQNFLSLKRPSDYADLMNLSTPYLNECVRNATGFPVSYHIQQRIVLEAKRLLFHSAKSVKEIAFELGFEDHTYFSRYFNKSAGLTPSAFRQKYFD